MTSLCISGKQLAHKKEEELALISSSQSKKKIVVIMVGDNPVSKQYVERKRAVAERIGVLFEVTTLPESSSQEEVIMAIHQAEENGCDGIVVQLPLPVHMNTQEVLDTIKEALDIDCLSSSFYSLPLEKMEHIPPVARAIFTCLEETKKDLRKETILIVGNGKLVGAPCAQMCKLHNIPYISIDITTGEEIKKKLFKEASIIISGTGVPYGITKDMIQEGVVLIDAGTSELSGKIVGDIDPSCYECSSYHTPVPGGIGPLAVVSLFANLFKVPCTVVH